MWAHMGNHKTLCNSSRPRYAGKKARAFLMEQASQSRLVQHSERGRVEWGGRRGNGVWVGRLGPRGGGIGSARACHIQFPFLGLIHLHGSTWICTSDITGASLNGFIAPAKACPRQWGKCPLILRRFSAAQNPWQDVDACAAASLHKELGRIGLRLYNMNNDPILRYVLGGLRMSAKYFLI